MALYDGFFDFSSEVLEETGKYDREYNAADFTGYFGAFIGDGVCVYQNPDSMRVSIESGRALVAPGYLFIQGYWLANQAEPGEENYRGYSVDLPASGEYAVVARLDLARSLIEITTLPKADSYPDCLVLALVDAANGTVEDTRADPDLCGIVDALGDLAAKVEYAVNYIDNEIEDRFQEAEEEIAAQNALLDAKIAEVAAEVEKITPPPIGSIKFTASQDVGPEWLRCDGSFVNENDYPELVAALGKLTPGVEDHKELLEATAAEQVSNMCLDNGIAWLYLVKSRKLVGVSPVNQIQINVSGANDLVELPAVDTVLSVCGGAVYLAQNNQNANTYVLLECASFSGNETEIQMTRLDTAELTAELDLTHCLPYVVDISGTKYMAVGEKIISRKSGSTATLNVENVIIAKWSAGQFANCETIPYERSIESMTNGNTAYSYRTLMRISLSLFAFQSKNASEMFFAQDNSYLYTDGTGRKSIYIYQGVGSVIKGTFGAPANSIDDTLPAYINDDFRTVETDPYYLEFFVGNINPPLNIVPVAGGGEYIYRAQIENRKVKFISGRYNPKTVYKFMEIALQLPARARLFKESVVYASAQGLWFIFVGTGLLFSETLENGKWGYLDTQEMAGVITQAGCVDYDEDANALYISGIATNGFPKVVRLQLPDLYNYANDGAWLPMIASDGVPAYIKAKEPEEEGAV